MKLHASINEYEFMYYNNGIEFLHSAGSRWQVCWYEKFDGTPIMGLTKITPAL